MDEETETPSGKSLPAGMTPWKPGQSGNPSGRPKKSLYIRLVEKALNDDRIAADLCEATIRQLKEGNGAYLKEALARVDGPVKELIEHSGTLSIEGLPDNVLEALTTVLEYDATKKQE